MAERPALTVPTTHGPVRGVPVAGGVAWRGIPYARPPVGPLRHRPPRAPEPWTEVRPAVEFGLRATQPDDPPHIALTEALFGTPPPPVEPSGEDCLFVNVTSPAADGAGRPVLFWIHGGGFHWGAGTDLIGDGLGLVAHDVVVVTFNYRLGVLGFLYLGELLGEEYARSGNAGLLDQVAALRWVRDNIAAFGGDPERITIAGMSAGGKSVAALMACPDARGLFARAFAISGGGEHVATRDDAAAQAERYLGLLGIAPADASQVLDRSPAELIEADGKIARGPRSTFVWRPVIDGDVLTDTPAAMIAGGSAQGVPLVAGTTIGESLIYDVVDPTAAEQAPRVLADIFGEAEVDRILAAHAATRPGASERDVLRAVMTDERYGIPTLRLLEAQEPHAPTWRYRSDFLLPWLDRAAGAHGGDFAMFWGAGRDDPADPLSTHPDFRALSDQMRASLAAFVTGEDPGAEGLPPWPRYDATHRATMLFDLTSHVAEDPTRPDRELWEHHTWPSSTWWQLRC